MSASTTGVALPGDQRFDIRRAETVDVLESTVDNLMRGIFRALLQPVYLPGCVTG
jgi:hypothetical protein